MEASDEINQLREEIRQMGKLAISRARRMATAFSVLSISLLISVVYGYVQQISAQKNAGVAVEQRKLAESNMEQASKNALEAQNQAKIANEMYRAFQECCDSKKK